VNFGGGPLTASGTRDLFVLEYTPGGAFSATRRYGGAGQESCTSVAAVAGGVLLAGSLDTTSDLGKGPITSAGQADMFVARYDASGAATLVLSGGGAGYDLVWGAAVGPSGRILAAGDLTDSGTFAGKQLTGAGARDIFLASFDAEGVLGWYQLHGGASYDSGSDVVVAETGDVFVTGYFSGTVDLGAGPVTSAGNDVFLASYAHDGALRWVRTWGSTGADEGQRLALGPDGTIFLVGQAGAPLDLDGTTVSGSFLVALR